MLASVGPFTPLRGHSEAKFGILVIKATQSCPNIIEIGAIWTCFVAIFRIYKPAGPGGPQGVKHFDLLAHLPMPPPQPPTNLSCLFRGPGAPGTSHGPRFSTGGERGKKGMAWFFLLFQDMAAHGHAVTVASGRQLFWRPRPRLRSLVPVTPAANPSERLGTRASGCAHWCHAWRQRRPILLNA